MRILLGLFIVLTAIALPFSAGAASSAGNSSGARLAQELRWPAFAVLNHAYAAKAVREEHGFRLEYRVDGREVVKQVAVPAELWDKMKGDFRPSAADVVLSASGELSSVGVQEDGRELWITYDRSTSTGQCLAMIYPSGRGIDDLSFNPTLECGS